MRGRPFCFFSESLEWLNTILMVGVYWAILGPHMNWSYFAVTVNFLSTYPFGYDFSPMEPVLIQPGLKFWMPRHPKVHIIQCANHRIIVGSPWMDGHEMVCPPFSEQTAAVWTWIRWSFKFRQVQHLVHTDVCCLPSHFYYCHLSPRILLIETIRSPWISIGSIDE